MRLRDLLPKITFPGLRNTYTSGAGPAISATGVGTARWSDRNYATLAHEGYRINAIAYRCIKLLSEQCAMAMKNLLHFSGDQEVDPEDSEVLKLIRNPAPGVSSADLWEAWFAYRLMSGNQYLEAVGRGQRATGAPRELWTHRPDRMKVIPGRFGLPMGFEYEANGVVKRWDVDQITAQGPILHLKEFHPGDDWYGMPRVDPAAYAIDRHNAGSAHNKAMLDNGVRPSGMLVFKPITLSNGEVVQTPTAMITEAERRLQERAGGPANAGKPLAVGGDVDWKQMGFDNVDMQFEEGMNSAARDICTAFGVPHILIVPGSATYNNIKEARLVLYEDTVLPMLENGIEGLSRWLLPRYGDDKAKLKPDYDKMSALEPRREQKRKGALELYRGKLITKNEARRELDYEPVDDGDEFDAPAPKAVAGPGGKMIDVSPKPGAKPIAAPAKPKALPKPARQSRYRRATGLVYERPAIRKAEAAYTDLIAGILEAEQPNVLRQIRQALAPMVIFAAKPPANDLERRIQEIVDAILFEELPKLGKRPEDIEAAAKDSAAEALTEVFGGSIRAGVFEQVNDRAVDYARHRAAELVGMRISAGGNLYPNPDANFAITSTTRDLLRGVLTDGLQRGLSQEEIVDEIVRTGLFSRQRAEMIAATEISTANSMGGLMGYRAARDAGVKLQKEWMVGANPCVACLANEKQGPIGLDERFMSGHLAPSAHPRCQCAIAAVVEDE